MSLFKPSKRTRVKVRRVVRKTKKAVEYPASGFLGTGKISKKATKERTRRSKARKKVLKSAWKKIW